MSAQELEDLRLEVQRGGGESAFEAEKRLLKATFKPEELRAAQLMANGLEQKELAAAIGDYAE